MRFLFILVAILSLSGVAGCQTDGGNFVEAAGGDPSGGGGGGGC